MQRHQIVLGRMQITRIQECRQLPPQNTTEYKGPSALMSMNPKRCSQTNDKVKTDHSGRPSGRYWWMASYGWLPSLSWQNKCLVSISCAASCDRMRDFPDKDSDVDRPAPGPANTHLRRDLQRVSHLEDKIIMKMFVFRFLFIPTQMPNHPCGWRVWAKHT